MKCEDIDNPAFKIFRCANEFVSAWHGIVPNDEISKRQFHTLGAIAFMQHTRKGGITVSDIAAHMGVSLPAASQIISALVDAGLLERVADDNDRRMIILKITKHGHESLRTALKRLLGLIEKETEGMDTELICESLTQLTCAVHKVAEITNKGETKPHA